MASKKSKPAASTFIGSVFRIIKYIFFASIAMFALLFIIGTFYEDDNLPSSIIDEASAETYAQKGIANNWPNIEGKQGANSPYSDTQKLLAKNYYIVLDGSGSMEETDCADGRTKMDVSIDALDQFLQNIPEDANYGFSLFRNSRFQELVALDSAVSKQQLIDELKAKLTPSGGTPLASALRAAQKKMVEQGKRQLGYGEYNLVLITDGLADEAEDPENVVNDILSSSPVDLSVIGFCLDDYNSLNQPSFVTYRTATDPESLQQSLQAVLAESPDFNLSEFGSNSSGDAANSNE